MKTLNTDLTTNLLKTFKNTRETKMIAGLNADYSPKYFFLYKGRIYQKSNFERAYANNFKYIVVDIAKPSKELSLELSYAF